MVHDIKIKEDYANRILAGVKNFEIRYNDRDYQVGDHIQFRVVDDARVPIVNKLNDMLYEIIYIHTGLGMKDGYVVLGIKKLFDIPRDDKEKQQ